MKRRSLSQGSRWPGRVVVAATLLEASAFAQSDERPPIPAVSSKMEDVARASFKEGNDYFDAGLYEAALAQFEAAYVAWPNPKIMLNIATTLRVLGRNAQALQAYRRYSSEGQPKPERKTEVDAICFDLLSRVATLRITADPDVQSLTLDGNRLAAEHLEALYVEPGQHVLVSLGAHGERVLRFDVQPGEARELALRSDAPAVADRASETPSAPAEATDAAPRRDHLSLWARADIDGLGRGVLGAGGLGFTLDASWQVAAGALIGARRGGWVGLERFVGEASVQPSIGLSMPVFFSGSAHVGVSLDAGARWAMGAELFLRGRAAVVHFPSVPDGYSKTVFVPSLGLEWQL